MNRALLPILAGALALAAVAWAGQAPGATVEGLVVDPRGKPIPGAAVWLGAEAEAPAAESGPDGRFVLRDLDPQDTLELFVCRSGSINQQVLVEASAPQIARVVLDPGARIDGLVVAPDGSPVAGAEVHASLETEDNGGCGLALPTPCQLGNSALGTTDGQGRFSLDGLLPGNFGLFVMAEGYPSAKRRVEAGFSVPPLTVELQTGEVLTGRILDRDGRPVSGAEISGSEPAKAISRSDGTYRLAGIPAGDSRILVSHPDHEPFSKTLRVEPGENRFDARLTRTLRYPVRGRVLDPDGQPLAGARVEVRGRSSTATGRDGRFVLLLEPGGYELESQAESYAPVWRSVQVAAGPLDAGDLRLTRGTTLTGRILGTSGEQLAGAEVSAHPTANPLIWSALADASGRYRLQGLSPGEWTLRVFLGPRQQEEKIVLTPGEEERELDIVLPEFFEVRGRVIGPEDEPVARAFVHFQGPAGGAYIPTEADGSFSTYLGEGTYQVKTEGQAAGYLEAVAPPLELRGPVDGIEIRLSQGATLRGRVTGLELDDPRNVSIAARNGSLKRYGRLTRDGVYRLTGLAPGAWEVEARHQMDKVRAEVRIAPGSREAVLDLAFTPGTLTLSGTIEGAADLPSLGILLERMDDEGETSAYADPEGSFRFTRLHPGRYRLTIHGAGPEGPHKIEIELSSDRELRVRLRRPSPNEGRRSPGPDGSPPNGG